MHGLINRAFQDFLVGAYGRDVWNSIRRDAGFEFEDFEPMLTYETSQTERLLHAVAHRLDKPISAFLEDVGTWIVANTEGAGIRRLLRFGGADFREFLFSLDELPGRAQMAVPQVAVPQITLNLSDPTRVELIVSWEGLNLSGMVLGAIRAIADDYGALVLMDAQETGPLITVIEVQLLDNAFAEGRSFELGGQQA